MTKRIATGLTTLIAGVIFVVACGQQAPAAVLGEWLFDDGDDNATVDSSGNGYDGGLYDFFDTSPNAGQFEGGSGWTDGALNFDGRGLDNTVADDSVRTSMPISAMSGRSFTVEAVVSHNWPGQNWSPFFGQSDDICCPDIFFFGKTNATEQLHYNIGGLSAGTNSSIVPVADGNPHHIALVFNDIANTIDVYFDHNVVQQQVGVTGT